TREGLSGSLEYSADLFDAPTVARLGGDFLDLLEKVVADPGLRLSDLPPRTRERRQEVRLRGYLIDPAEIEAALLRRSEVGQAVVVVREDAPGERRLVAYAAPRTPGQAALDADALRRGLREILPGYMVPETTVWLEALPLGADGTPDRSALPAPAVEARSAVTAASEAAPRTATEATLGRIWADLLRLERAGIHDDFFAAGGDSILSLQLVARAHQAGI